MVRLVKISKPELLPNVAIAYEDDTELFDKYHIAKMGFMDCVVATMGMIMDASVEKDLRYYKVLYKNESVGYVVEFDNFLYSYGINIKFRKKDILIDWWQQVKNIMGGNFMTMLYENNSRAVQFLEKNGMETMHVDKENHSIVLVYNPSLKKLKVA